MDNDGVATPRLRARGGLLQDPAHHVEPHLRRLELDHRSRSEERERPGACRLPVAGDGDRHGADWLLRCSARWPGDAGNPDADRRAGLRSNAFGERGRDRLAHRPVRLDAAPAGRAPDSTLSALLYDTTPPSTYAELPGMSVRRDSIRPPVHDSAAEIVSFRSRRSCPTISSMWRPSVLKTSDPSAATI